MLHLDLPLRIGSSGGCAIIVVVPEASFLLFIVTIMVWTLAFITINRPVEAGVAGIIIVLGLFSYLLTEKLSRPRQAPQDH